MPIDAQLAKDGTLTITLKDLNRGLDSASEPTETSTDRVPDLQNVTTDGGYPSGMPGSTLHIAGFVAPDAAAPQMLTRYRPETGTEAYIMACQDGHVYKSTDGGATWTSLRQGLTTGATAWWSHTQIGNYLCMGNGTDPIYKYDGTTLLPVGAKLIATCDLGEAALWAGETADATNVKEGLGAIYAETAGAAANMVYTPAANYNAVTGLLAARDYETDKAPGTDYYHFKARFTDTGTIDTTNTRVLLTDGDAETLNFPYTVWRQDRSGTMMPAAPVVGTWYDVYLLASTGTDSATFDSTNIDTFTFSVARSAGTLRMAIDDIYLIYAETMPPCQILREFKGMLLGADGLNVYYSPTGGVDQFDTVDTSVVVVPTSGGSEVTGMHEYGDYMLIATDSSVHSLHVQFRNLLYPDYDFTRQEVTTEHGCTSHRSMVMAAGKVWMHWRNNLHAFAGIGTTKTSEIIDPTLEDIEPTRLAYVVGGRLHDANQLYWWWTPAGGTQNTKGLAYNTVQQAFLPMVGNTAALAENVIESDVEYLLTATYAGRVLDQNDGTTWDGTAITRFLTLPWLSAGRPNPVVSWRRFHINYETQAAGTLIVEARTANHPSEFSTATYSTLASLDMTTAEEWGGITFHLRAPWLQMRLRTVGAQLALYWPLEIVGVPLWRRG